MDHGSELAEVEELAIAGRYREAYKALNGHLADRSSDERSLVAAGCLEDIAVRIADTHPQVAIRLYEKVLTEYRNFAGSASTAAEGEERWNTAEVVAGRIKALKDRARK